MMRGCCAQPSGRRRWEHASKSSGAERMRDLRDLGTAAAMLSTVRREACVKSTMASEKLTYPVGLGFRQMLLPINANNERGRRIRSQGSQIEGDRAEKILLPGKVFDLDQNTYITAQVIETETSLECAVTVKRKSGTFSNSDRVGRVVRWPGGF